MNKEKKVKLGKLEIGLNELAEFIVEAKKNCYAGNGKEQRLKDGSKVLTFQKGNFHYEDNYDGWYQAPGRELVRWKNEEGQRIWQMSYAGGMLPENFEDKKLTKQTFDFLKEVLITVTTKHPFRAKEAEIIKKVINGNEFSYQCNITKGDIRDFLGDEKIWTTKQDCIIFKQNYIGGLVIPK